ncbi:MAG: hypothetical protein IT305_06285 [Chloroflexi bacterium]|nr:hypothetical protein [Chloroflexota bacterium]
MLQSMKAALKAALRRVCAHASPDQCLPQTEGIRLDDRQAEATLHVDRNRQPRDGDIVYAEVVRRGSAERLVRRFEESDGFVTLTPLAGSDPPIMRPAVEVRILGVIR